MTPKSEVFWATIAENDLIEIVEYIAEDNLTKARNIFEKIKEKASSLSYFPERGRIVPELKDHGIIIYRELIVSPWRIIYRISENNVHILSIIDSHRNVDDILLKRLIE